MKTIGEDIVNGKHSEECTLMLDEAALHKAQGWDPRWKTYIGRCTTESLDEEGTEEDDLTTQVLVFMVVGLVCGKFQ